MANDIKNTLIISDYDRAFHTLLVCQKTIKDSELYLYTANKNVDKVRSNFNLILRNHYKAKDIFVLLKQIYSLRKYHFQSVVIDYGFNIISIMTILLVRPPEVYILDLFKKNPLQQMKTARLISLIFQNIKILANKLLIKISIDTRMKKVLGLPLELSIECSAVCDLKCEGCPTGLKLLSRPVGMLKFEKLEYLLEKNRNYFQYLERVFPFLYGEALLNPEIFKIIGTIRKTVSKNCLIILHTHGSFPEPEKMAERVIDSNVDQVSVSLDGPDKETYEKFRVGGGFDKVIRFIKSLVAAREKRGVYSPEILVQMIITKHTEDKIEEMEKLCSDLKVDRMVRKGYWYEFNLSDDKTNKELNPQKEPLNPYDNSAGSSEEAKKIYIKNKKNRCGWVYKTMVINWDGSISPCCVDSDGKLLSSENIFNSNVKKIWNGEAYRKLRKKILKGEIDLCSKCFVSSD